MSALDEPSFVAAEPAKGDLDSALTMTPRLSRIGLSIDEWDIKGDKIKGEGKLEIDFAGGSGTNAIRLRHAYAAITANKKLELLAGQTTDLMSPLFPSAQNDTQLRYAGNLGDRRPQLQLGVYPHHMVHLAVAAAASGVLDPHDMDGDGEVDAMASARPMLQWLLEMRTRAASDNIARVGISGHVSREELADGTRHGSASVGVHMMAPFGRKVMLLGEGYVGKNLSDVGGGIGQGVNPVTNEGIHSIGGWLELAVLPTSRHMLAFGNSIDTARSEDLEMGDRERNSTLYGVLRYRPRPSLQLGLEVLHWRTAYKEMADGVANRFDMHFSVFF
ncbi:MAG TPA: hypothetical protein VFQ53_04770 [Kofleriaceae bacterium]|nr:hypothetical protein [Kofleriaceae bacterium]